MVTVRVGRVKIALASPCPPAGAVRPRARAAHTLHAVMGTAGTLHLPAALHCKMQVLMRSALALGATAILFMALPPIVRPAAQALPPDYGPQPSVPPPKEGWLPTVKWSVAKPWSKGRVPKAAAGLQVVAFAQGLKHLRWLHVLPNGDVLVAEAATEPSPSWQVGALIQNSVQRRTGAIVENANRISLLRDADPDGVAEQQFVLLEGLRQPFGMALVGDHLYVANTDSVVRFPYQPGDTRIADKGTKLLDLPVGHHWTRALLASPDGTKLYVTVGSGSNIGENGMDLEKGRATILELDIGSGRARVFASGQRNANGMAFEPTSGALWTVVNERDEIGDDVPPDYLTSVKDGGFYGWPYSYWGKNVDRRVQPQRPDLVATSRPTTRWVPIPPHSASLTMAARSCPHSSKAVCSSVSTAPGTATSTAATRSSFYHSRKAGRSAPQSMC
jgi:glucose/arabinose dehydrogenase